MEGKKKENLKDRKIIRKKDSFHTAVREWWRTGSLRPINYYRCHFPLGVTRRVVPKFEHITPWRVCLWVSGLFFFLCHTEGGATRKNG